MLERDYEMECNTMQYQLKVVPWHLSYHISLSCLMNRFASHLLHVSFDSKALTEDSDLQQELQLGAEARKVCWNVCSVNMPSNSHTIARCISLFRQLWKSWTEISSKTMNTWEPAERNTHHTIVKVEGKQLSWTLTMTWWVDTTAGFGHSLQESQASGMSPSSSNLNFAAIDRREWSFNITSLFLNLIISSLCFLIIGLLILLLESDLTLDQCVLAEAKTASFWPKCFELKSIS